MRSSLPVAPVQRRFVRRNSEKTSSEPVQLVHKPLQGPESVVARNCAMPLFVDTRSVEIAKFNLAIRLRRYAQIRPIIRIGDPCLSNTKIVHRSPGEKSVRVWGSRDFVDKMQHCFQGGVRVCSCHIVLTNPLPRNDHFSSNYARLLRRTNMYYPK